jgi:hypothetical protein
MRGSRTLLIVLGAVVSAGLLVELAGSAAGFTLSGSSSSSSSGTTTSTTSGVSTTTTATATSEDVTAALFALAAGGKTIGGPGTFLAGVDGEARIYEVLTGGGANACVTLRNLSSGQIRVSVNTAMSTDVNAGESRTSCYMMPSLIDLRCRQGTACQAVWRVDRQ